MQPTSTIRRRKPPMTKILIESAVAFMGQAVNLQNATQIAQRHEKVAIAMATAWEKILKAFLYRIDRRIIYYPLPRVQRGQPRPKRKTLSLDRCLDEVQNRLGKPFEATKAIIEQAGEYRNECIHFYGERLDAVLMPLFSQCCLNFSEFLRQHFSRELFSELELAILPLAYQLPFVAEDFLTTHNASHGASQEVKDFLQGLTDVGRRLHESGHTDSILVKYHLALVSVKNSGEADGVVHVDNAAPSDTTIRIERPVQGEIRLTSSRNAAIVRLSDDDLPRHGYVLGYQDLLFQVMKEGYKWDEGVKNFVKSLREDASLCYVRKANPMSVKSSTTCLYHTDVQARLMEYLLAKGARRAA
ncbi:DUF3644 domain-containing protein [Hymenobacter sp. 5317J-9]|uniref:DUF3644 domain-containing protein n=1 Tax=Hymenobacter sp. 5317J-9 TaxID=2932250 RepID=UPI001FD6EF55|nr:DUF3644 domain-containing protein [Hymenobacter sp. 5317J-9]UOQ96428.1 DUF3644 domain-containing protein [Hymenobacter sp. 5317J-9]